MKKRKKEAYCMSKNGPAVITRHLLQRLHELQARLTDVSVASSAVTFGIWTLLVSHPPSNTLCTLQWESPAHYSRFLCTSVHTVPFL